MLHVSNRMYREKPMGMIEQKRPLADTEIEAAALAIVNVMRATHHFGPMTKLEDLIGENEPDQFRKMAKAALIAARDVQCATS